MNNIAIAKETLKIVKEMKYMLGGREIALPKMDYANVRVYSPEAGAALINAAADRSGELCRIRITAEDSYEAAARYENCMVMNFANAHNPGGGFLMGATAQEESLCRCSTLYASISGEAAKEMYKYNNTHPSKVESDYMLYSEVCVFRNKNGELLEQPFLTGVVTVPAPNRIGAALLASNEAVAEAMKRRIRILCLVARENGCRNLVLGAWGCGAFHNKPKHVAKYFRTVLIEEGYGTLFDEICFAIYGREDGQNITVFRECFGV